MKKYLIITALLAFNINIFAQQFEDYFEDRTLRLDYTFAGCDVMHNIYVDELVSLPHWYGRRHRLAELPLKGNGQITVRSKIDSVVIYRHAFSTLFQEWLATDEAKNTQKSFENVFLVPFPKAPVEIKVELSLQDRFQIIALKSVSQESGTSEPSRGIWKNTVLGSHFDTFYSDRYLTTLHLKRLHDVLAGTPYEHVIILVNTEHYGGGGIYNSYNLSYTGGSQFLPVVVHEFGHSFGGLGDEYTYGNDDPIYFDDTEPWEPNLTTKATAFIKWENLIKAGKAGLIEGGGYQEKGVWRGCENCRMRTNEEPEFCAVCKQALKELIDFYTE